MGQKRKSQTDEAEDGENDGRVAHLAKRSLLLSIHRGAGDDGALSSPPAPSAATHAPPAAARVELFTPPTGVPAPPSAPCSSAFGYLRPATQPPWFSASTVTESSASPAPTGGQLATAAPSAATPFSPVGWYGDHHHHAFGCNTPGAAAVVLSAPAAAASRPFSTTRSSPAFQRAPPPHLPPAVSTAPSSPPTMAFDDDVSEGSSRSPSPPLHSSLPPVRVALSHSLPPSVTRAMLAETARQSVDGGFSLAIIPYVAGGHMGEGGSMHAFTCGRAVAATASGGGGGTGMAEDAPVHQPPAVWTNAAAPPPRAFAPVLAPGVGVWQPAGPSPFLAPTAGGILATAGGGGANNEMDCDDL